MPNQSTEVDSTVDGHRIRAASESDRAAVQTIQIATGLFAADELGDSDAMFDGSMDGSLVDHFWIVSESEAGVVVGAAYFAPEPFSDRMWNLYFIGVLPEHQGSGTGGALVHHVEQSLRSRGGDVARTLIVETSSLAGFAGTRAFYAARGFDEEARIRDFYAPDESKVVFWKSLVADSV